MARLTKENYLKWSCKASNGFVLDIENYITWDEKTLKKDVKNEDGTIKQYLYRYFPDYESKKNCYGVAYNVRTGKQQPEFIENLLTPLSSGCYRVLEKKRVKIGELQKNKNFSYLCKLSKEFEKHEKMEG